MLTRQFLFFSILVHLLLGVGASVYIVQTVSTRPKANFTAATAPSAPASANREHKVQMQKKQQAMSAPTQMKRITTAAPNARISLPDMPAMPTLTNNLTPSLVAGMGGTGLGLTVGTGAPSAAGGGRSISLFGLRTGGSGSLVGTFYDFKQSPNGQPTNMAIVDSTAMTPAEQKPNDINAKLIAQFANGGFSEGMVTNYFKGPQPLYTSQIFIPVISADDGPKEFNLADKVKPRRWAVVYRGIVTPPESGRYHFVGTADDYLIVRFRGRIVLDGSLFQPLNKKPLKQYSYKGLLELYHCNEGDPVDVVAGEHYPIEILIGEQPGGVFCTFLMLEKEGVTYQNDPKGGPILPVFKVGQSPTPKTGDGIPATWPDQSWSVWPATSKP